MSLHRVEAAIGDRRVSQVYGSRDLAIAGGDGIAAEFPHALVRVVDLATGVQVAGPRRCGSCGAHVDVEGRCATCLG